VAPKLKVDDGLERAKQLGQAIDAEVLFGEVTNMSWLSAIILAC
jgi:hypothetical protein